LVECMGWTLLIIESENLGHANVKTGAAIVLWTCVFWFDI
jgi:hypothetical protein